jgi:hypothetical protein
MAESTLTLTYWDALDEVSRMLGWGTGHTNADRLALVRGLVEAGYRQFLHPLPLPPSQRSHVWSFLSPKTTVTMRTEKESGTVATASVSTTTLTDTTAEFESYGVAAGDSLTISAGGATAGTYTVDSVTSETVLVTTATMGSGTATYTIDEEAWMYPLPDDFGSLAVQELVVNASGAYYPFPIRGEAWIRAKRAIADRTGRPLAAAIRPKSLARETGQRWELLVWPDPDDTYSVEYRYNVLPGKWGHVRTSGTTATVDTSAKTITLTGETFDTDGCIAGDKVVIWEPSVATITTGIYVIATVDSETQITLTTAPGADGTVDYDVLPATLYPLGGLIHAETLMASCRAVAQRHVDKEKGWAWEEYIERLGASTSQDMELQPRNFGYNRDESVDPPSRTWFRSLYAEYEGTVYGDYAP